MQTRAYPKPEIMSPAGYWPQLRAAIEAGADAVYFGLTHFTARAKVGFTLDELPEVVRTLHSRGVKGYLTFNTLVFDGELEKAARWLAQVAESGVDSLIVQDIGVAQLAHAIAPHIALHGSTQMSISSAEGVEMVRQFGVNRVVLARELSLQDIRHIRAQTDCELEMFVHGALCVSYSGQCFSSEAWGGRSANRGQCAQACRLPYDLIVDDARRDVGDKRYLLSPGDLYALEQMPEIVGLGVSALKIEGRYKDAEYVALTTAAYRKAVDEAYAGQALSVTPVEKIELEQVYSRGLGPWFVSGVNHQQVVDGRAPRHRGVKAGRVLRVTSDGVIVAADPAIALAPLKPGDGVVFDAADWRSPEEPEEGGHIFEVIARGRTQVELRFGNGAIRFHRIRSGDLLWRTHDVNVERAARPYVNAQNPVHLQPLAVQVTACVGKPLQTTWSLLNRPSIQVSIVSDAPLQTATQKPLDEATLREQLGRLGNTPYRLDAMEAAIEGAPFAPLSMLNTLRRDAVAALQARQIALPALEVYEPLATFAKTLDHQNTKALNHLNTNPLLHLLVRTPEQLDAALAMRPDSITLDYLELYGLRPSVERVQEAGIAVRVASPRVLKPDEGGIVNFLVRLGAPVLVRSTGLLNTLRQLPNHPPLTGDFSLNAANVITARSLLALGLDRLTPTYDLNATQTANLAAELPAGATEVIAYAHLPVFHTEHCVFCRFLSSGTSYKDCGHPCEQHKVALRDHSGRLHPVLADVGCRNTVFGAEAQNGAHFLGQWRAAGVSHYRLEFAHENGQQVRVIAQAFAEALQGTLSARELERRLQQAAPQGITEGSLFVPPGMQEIPLFA